MENVPKYFLFGWFAVVTLAAPFAVFIGRSGKYPDSYKEILKRFVREMLAVGVFFLALGAVLYVGKLMGVFDG